jgi:hypothetical protein
MPQEMGEALPTSGRLPAIRQCAGCTLCCKVVAVRELAKPGGVWCPHCRAGIGCTIYESRPSECATYECGYLVLPSLGEEWKPSTSRLIISREVSKTRLDIHVDPGRPDAWRRQPYYGVIKQWSQHAVTQREQVVVIVGERTIVILPDHDVDLGVMAADEMIAIVETPSGGARQYEAYAVRRDSEIGSHISAAEGKAVPLAAGGPTGGFRKGRRLA